MQPTRMTYEDLRGKVVLVTGGSRGIGRAMALAFLGAGARVAVNYKTHEAAARDLRQKAGSDLGIFQADVSVREEVKNMFLEIKKSFGDVDVLVNNAGVMKTSTIDSFDEKLFMDMFRVNVLGTIYCTLEALPAMKKKHHGSIVNVTSNAVLGTAVAGTTYYAMTKAAVMMFTRRLAFEGGSNGIRANALAPGWTETDMTVAGRAEEEVAKTKRSYVEKTSLGYVGKPEDMAKLALFLASDDSWPMTGQMLVADGGRLDNLSHSL